MEKDHSDLLQKETISPSVCPSVNLSKFATSQGSKKMFNVLGYSSEFLSADSIGHLFLSMGLMNKKISNTGINGRDLVFLTQ